MECALRDKSSSLSHQKHVLCCKMCYFQTAAHSGARISLYNLQLTSDQNTHKQTRAHATAGLFLSFCSHWPADNNCAHISVQIWQCCVSRASAMTQIHASVRHMHGVIIRSVCLQLNSSFSVSVWLDMTYIGPDVHKKTSLLKPLCHVARRKDS